MATNKVKYFGNTLIDLTGDDATAADVLSGKKFHLASGVQTIGTLVPGGSTSDATATAADILSPKTAYIAGGKVTGKIQTQVGATITPTTTEQTAVPAGTYVSSTVKVEGSANLVASNIRKDIVVFGVTGTLEASAGLVILVSAPAGATVTASKSGNTYNGVEDAQNPGNFTVTVPEYGTYTVTATDGAWSRSGNVSIKEASITLARIPDGYTQLEYLESTGAQYIDTGYAFDVDVSVESEIASTDNVNDNVFFGLYDTGASCCFVSSNHWKNMRAEWNATNSGETTAHIEYDTDFHVFYMSNGLQSVDEATDHITSSSARSNRSYYIFARNQQYIAYGKCKIKYLNMQRNGDFIRQFIPVRRNSDSVLGMYDIISGNLYTNAGSGTFVAGPDVT